mmetsp:Transcript_6304/g.13609  ORF Transcript_6304/g.13609 Transcript_6304/m.13609 type:complete len:112 (+) Transcript_6304:154-489(+)
MAAIFGYSCAVRCPAHFVPASRSEGLQREPIGLDRQAWAGWRLASVGSPQASASRRQASAGSPQASAGRPQASDSPPAVTASFAVERLASVVGNSVDGGAAGRVFLAATML